MLPHEDIDFKNTALYLNNKEGITMRFEFDYSIQSWIVRLSKENYHIRVAIAHEDVKNQQYFSIVGKAVTDLKAYMTNIKQPQTLSNSISLPKGWLAKELNMTHTEFDLEKIKIMKESAKNVLDRESFVFNGILAGGCFTSWYHQEVPKDFDLFVIDETLKRTILARSTELGRFKVSDGAYMNNNNIEHAILDTQTKIQYILVKYKTRREIIDHFDAEHTAVSYDHENDKLYMSPSTYQCIKNKILKPHNNNIIVPWREEKFKQRGFKFETVSV